MNLDITDKIKLMKSAKESAILKARKHKFEESNDFIARVPKIFHFYWNL